jgi:hypothetical protein
VAISKVKLHVGGSPVQTYVHNANVEHYRRLISESERDPKRDENRHAMLLTLLAEEIAKDQKRER